MINDDKGGKYIVLWLPSEFDEVMLSTPGESREEITNEGRAAFVSGMLMALADVMGFPHVKEQFIAHNMAEQEEQDST